MNRGNILLAVECLAVLVMALFFVSFSSKDDLNKHSDLFVANVDALAQEKPSDKTCTAIGYKEIWVDGCLYNCAQCAEGFFVPVSLIRCLAR